MDFEQWILQKLGFPLPLFIIGVLFIYSILSKLISHIRKNNKQLNQILQLSEFDELSTSSGSLVTHPSEFISFGFIDVLLNIGILKKLHRSFKLLLKDEKLLLILTDCGYIIIVVSLILLISRFL